jgi:hypothetical protein
MEVVSGVETLMQVVLHTQPGLFPRFVLIKPTQTRQRRAFNFTLT